MNNGKEKQKLSSESFFTGNRIQVDESTLSDSSFSNSLSEKLHSLHLNINGEKPKNSMKVKDIFTGRLLTFIGYPTIALLGIIAFVLLAIPLLKNTNLDPRDQKIAAELTYSEGTVEYKDIDEDWTPVSEGMTISEGTSIRVIGEGKAIVSIDDGSAIRLDKDSGITLDSMDPKNIVISNDAGSVYSRVVEAERSFTVKTEDAEYKSIGTSYKTVNSETKKGVEVYQSKVEIESTKLTEGLTVEEGQKFYFENENPELKDKLSELTIEEITADEFALWNKEQDEKVEEYKTSLGKLGDLTPPSLIIETPADGAATRGDAVAVAGTTEPGSRIWINGNEVENKNGSYDGEIVLQNGANKIEVKSMDSAGNKTYKYVTVTKIVDAPESTSSTGISLSGVAVDGGIKLTWSITGLDVSKGFKIVKSKTSSSPTYPNDTLTFVEGSQRTYTVSVTGGQTYYFRICQYNGSGCSVYSNSVKVTAPASKVQGETTGPATISLSHTGGANVSWTVTSGTAAAFKLVWSKITNPTYGSNGYAEYKTTTSGTISAYNGPGEYFVRVCRYTGSGCDSYSNQISINL